MQVEQLIRLLMNDDEISALYEVCAISLEKNLLEGYPLAFALAVFETLAEEDDIDMPEGVEQITIN